MAKILVCGGGPVGLTAGMLLARDGHEVTLLEKDPGDVPASIDEAWDDWERKGVAQFRQAHFVQPLFRQVMAQELPGVLEALEEAGGTRFSALSMMPPFITDREPRPDDERFETVTGRRPMLERVIAARAADEPGLEIRRGVTVDGLVTGPSTLDSVPHVVGVRTADGEELSADLVIDALGRRSQLPEWIASAGGVRPHEEALDCGFTYYTRFFRSADGATPAPMAGLLTPVGTISLLTLPCDNGTWSVTIYAESGDAPLKAFRHADVFTKVVEACPLHAHWLAGEPITDILPMAGIPDRYRRFVTDGEPVATGVLAVGDAWACTNPSLGRGISLGVLHASRLRDVVREHGDDPAELARVWDLVTEDELAPWYWAQLAIDEARHAEIEALREGREPPLPTDGGKIMAEAMTAMLYDPDVFRGFLEMMSCLTLPEKVLARPGMVDRIREVAASAEPFEIPGPSRDELLALVK